MASLSGTFETWIESERYHVLRSCVNTGLYKYRLVTDNSPLVRTIIEASLVSNKKKE